MVQDDEDLGFQPQNQNAIPDLLKRTALDDAFEEEGDNTASSDEDQEEPNQGNDALGEEDLTDLENRINE